MTLLELLVKELPKCGGWPEGATVAVQDGYKRCVVPGKVKFAGTGCAISFRGDNWSGSWRYPGFRDFKASYLATDYEVAVVSRDQYEAALTQRQPVESWNGEGLPPVGCECETIHRSCDSWQQIKVVAVNGGAVFGFWNAGNTPCALPVDVYQFRPTRTEADKKRDEAVNEMVEIYRSGLGTTEHVFQELYDAIAEGKIPGVKLEA